jgi:hypothetical protein
VTSMSHDPTDIWDADSEAADSYLYVNSTDMVSNYIDSETQEWTNEANSVQAMMLNSLLSFYGLMVLIHLPQTPFDNHMVLQLIRVISQYSSMLMLLMTMNLLKGKIQYSTT